MSPISLLARSTDPWLWLCLGFPCTIFKPFHIALSSVITEFTNSLLLSLCKILGAPKMLKISSNWYTISGACFDVTERSCTNFIRWSSTQESIEGLRLVDFVHHSGLTFIIRFRPPWPIARWASYIKSNISSSCTKNYLLQLGKSMLLCFQFEKYRTALTIDNL